MCNAPDIMVGFAAFNHQNQHPPSPMIPTLRKWRTAELLVNKPLWRKTLQLAIGGWCIKRLLLWLLSGAKGQCLPHHPVATSLNPNFTKAVRGLGARETKCGHVSERQWWHSLSFPITDLMVSYAVISEWAQIPKGMLQILMKSLPRRVKQWVTKSGMICSARTYECDGQVASDKWPNWKKMKNTCIKYFQLLWSLGEINLP